jgi:hypothetical protein
MRRGFASHYATGGVRSVVQGGGQTEHDSLAALKPSPRVLVGVETQVDRILIVLRRC